MRSALKILSIACFFLVNACNNRCKECLIYERLNNTSANQSQLYFSSLSINDRFEVYKDAYQRSGHPKPTYMAAYFSDKPEQALQYIRERNIINNYDTAYMYFWILYEINKRSDIDICKNKNYNIIVTTMKNYIKSPAVRRELNLSFRKKNCRPF